ncbi:Anaerobic regulatory protein [Crenothrix polyspora]|uniref:Anaerobic regulatory protein n=1 Tax=Crenothrix polyspora TaxID=360316 RepID=A0A1R4GYI1_9GAMM|nr:Anaerobic regulatory protein [Crenothrix polyspora]
MESNVHKISCPDCRLSDLCLPYGLQKNEVQQLATIVKNKRPIHTDEYLYLQGDTCQNLYAVKSGSFRSFIADDNGSEQTIGFYLPGELMGLDALQHGRSTCSIVALETSTVCELPLSHLNELCSQIPSLQHQMMRILGKEISSDHDKIIMLGHRSAKEKMATFLLMLSRRYSGLGFSSTEFNLSMRRQDIANFLGLTVETVSRQFTELNKDGIITVKQRGIQINDITSLKAIVKPCMPDDQLSFIA